MGLLHSCPLLPADRAADRVADTVAGVVGIEVVEPDTEVVVAEQAVERVAARVVVQEQEQVLVQERALEPAMLLFQEFENQKRCYTL